MLREFYVNRAYSVLGRGLDFALHELYQLEQRVFDLRYGVSTRERTLTDSDVYTVGGNNWPYAGCHWPALSLALRDLNPAESDVFVDLGSGKGKAMLIAGHLPYKRVIGVEIDGELARLAERNLMRGGRQFRAGKAEQVIADVIDWPIPDSATTIFMFNPFFGETFRAVLATIFASYDHNPRDLHIVYEYPWEHDWLVGTGRTVVEDVRSNVWPPRPRWWARGEVIVTYRVTGAGQPPSSSRCRHRLRRASSAAMCRWQGPNGHPFKDDGPRGVTRHSGRPS